MEFAVPPANADLAPAEILQEVPETFLVRITDATLPLTDACPSLPWVTDPHVPGSQVLPLAALTGVLCHGAYAAPTLQDLPLPAYALLPSAAHRLLSHLVSSGLSLGTPYNSTDEFIAAVRDASESAGNCQQLLLTPEDLFPSQRFQDANQVPPNGPQGGRGRGRGNQGGRGGNHANQLVAAGQPPVIASNDISFVAHVKIGTLADGTGLLAPYGDLCIAIGNWVLAVQRAAGSQFHSLMSDIKAKQPSEVTRDHMMAGLSVQWWASAMWPQPLRNTTFDSLQNQLDVSARARYMDRSQRGMVLTERFAILLRSLPNLSDLCGSILPSEAHALLSPMCRQLVPLPDDSAIDQYFELDRIVGPWLHTVSSTVELVSARDKVHWIAERVKGLDKANKLLPLSSQSSLAKGKKGGARPIADKVHSALMSQLITSPDFTLLWEVIKPLLAQIKSGAIEDSLDDTLAQVLGYCYANDDHGGPICWVVQWLASDLSALPYHLFFTEMMVVRNKKAVYIGNCVARDAAGFPLEGSAGFVVMDEVVSKMDNGEFHLIHFYNDLVLPLRSYLNQSRETAIDPGRMWKETEIMREILPVGNNLFQAYGFGSSTKDNSFGSLIEKVISFIQGAATPMKAYHIQKVAANMPRILKAAGETFLEAMYSPPSVTFPTSFLNPVTHAAHLEDLRINAEASRQMTTLSRAYPGLMNHLAAAAVDPNTAFIPQTGLVIKYKSSPSSANLTSKARQRPRAQGSQQQSRKQNAQTPSASSSQSSTASTQRATPYQKTTPYVSGKQAAKKQKPSTPEEWLGIASHIVKENQSTVIIMNPKTQQENKYSKTEMAKHLKCKAEDKCWPVGVSVKPSPQNLMLCNNKRHKHNDPAHDFPAGFSALVQQPPFRLP